MKVQIVLLTEQSLLTELMENLFCTLWILLLSDVWIKNVFFFIIIFIYITMNRKGIDKNPFLHRTLCYTVLTFHVTAVMFSLGLGRITLAA